MLHFNMIFIVRLLIRIIYLMVIFFYRITTKVFLFWQISDWKILLFWETTTYILGPFGHYSAQTFLHEKVQISTLREWVWMCVSAPDARCGNGLFFWLFHWPAPWLFVTVTEGSGEKLIPCNGIILCGIYMVGNPYTYPRPHVNKHTYLV